MLVKLTLAYRVVLVKYFANSIKKKILSNFAHTDDISNLIYLIAQRFFFKPVFQNFPLLILILATLVHTSCLKSYQALFALLCKLEHQQQQQEQQMSDPNPESRFLRSRRWGWGQSDTSGRECLEEQRKTKRSDFERKKKCPLVFVASNSPSRRVCSTL